MNDAKKFGFLGYFFIGLICLLLGGTGVAVFIWCGEIIGLLLIAFFELKSMIKEEIFFRKNIYPEQKRRKKIIKETYKIIDNKCLFDKIEYVVNVCKHEYIPFPDRLIKDMYEYYSERVCHITNNDYLKLNDELRNLIEEYNKLKDEILEFKYKTTPAIFMHNYDKIKHIYERIVEIRYLHKKLGYDIYYIRDVCKSIMCNRKDLYYKYTMEFIEFDVRIDYRSVYDFDSKVKYICGGLIDDDIDKDIEMVYEKFLRYKK